MLADTPTLLELHRRGYVDNEDGCLEMLKVLGNTRYAMISREYFVNRRSIPALMDRHHIARSTVISMLRMAIDKLNDKEADNG